MEPKTRYVVRRPGNTAWSTHRTLTAARRERDRADQVIPGHRVYRETKDTIQEQEEEL
jgi:hypothetical protein